MNQIQLRGLCPTRSSWGRKLTWNGVNLGSQHLQKVDLFLALSLIGTRGRFIKRRQEVSTQQVKSSEGAYVRHVDDTFVPPRATDVCQSDTSVASGTFDDGSSRLDAS